MNGKHIKKGKDKNNAITYIITVILSVLLLVIGYKFAVKDLIIYSKLPDQEVVKAKVTEVVDRTSESYGQEDESETVTITFNANIQNGNKKGDTVTAVQSIGGLIGGSSVKEISKNDKILLVYSDMEEHQWKFMDYIRSDKLMILGAIFVIALLIFGRWKGFNTLLSLIFTCAAIFAVFIPSILSGKNIYLWSILVCVYTILMTLFIVDGLRKKTLAAAIGCFSGIALSGILTVIMDHVLSLTGFVNEDSVYLSNIPLENPVNLRAIIFAAIIIGAMGAIMDVAMSISSSLWEVSEKANDASFDTLFKSGMNIGRDVMGTMANTLVLAYIGTSLSIVLLLSVYNTSLLALFNREMIIVEILQALIGSFGILFTIPLTSFVCSILYTKKPKILEEDNN